MHRTKVAHETPARDGATMLALNVAPVTQPTLRRIDRDMRTGASQNAAGQSLTNDALEISQVLEPLRDKGFLILGIGAVAVGDDV